MYFFNNLAGLSPNVVVGCGLLRALEVERKGTSITQEGSGFLISNLDLLD